MTAVASGDVVVASSDLIRRRGRYLVWAAVVLLCAWILIPIYLLLVNTLSSEAAVNGFPKSFVPSFDLESLNFFLEFDGVVDSMINSVIVAALTMVMSIAAGAPAGELPEHLERELRALGIL